MSILLKLLLDQPSDLLDQLHKNKSDLKPIHLAIAAEQKLRDVCLYLKEFVPNSACSDPAKEYLSTLKGYSLTIGQSGTKTWWLNGELHREDGAAIENLDGYNSWYLNGKQHRENGPARTWPDGRQEWWLNGKHHRENGPARTWPDGSQEWWLNDQVTEQKAMGTDKIQQLLLDQPDDLLDQLYKNKSSLKPIHLAVAAEKQMRDVCLYIKRFVPNSACSDPAKEYLTTSNGYSLTIGQSGTKIWWLNGKRHREDGPAYNVNGNKSWWLNGKRHREGGPAFEDANGIKEWWLNGKRHRVDGPAFEDANGYKEWYLHGKGVTEQDVMGSDKIQQLSLNQHENLLVMRVPLYESLETLIDLHGAEEVFSVLGKIVSKN